MDSSRWEQIQALFHEAALLPRPEQEAFLTVAAQGDRQLILEVLAMLEEDECTSLLDRGVSEIVDNVLTDSTPAVLPREFGAYRILQILGEGGMGIVYLSERKDLGSKVAIKVLRDAWLSPARRERFASEQRLLAQLTHPSIARLYDADTLPDGTPWFAMEYVDGVPLTQYCQLRSCTIRERLHLFRAVCEAVQYAHGLAVIHRDLKPSNILVKHDGTIRLLDFGIAKQLEGLDAQVNLTITGLRLMTPAYAAPEQIRGEQSGVYTDVYSLGMILFELLSGELPFDFSNLTPGEAISVVVDSEPGKPSSRSKAKRKTGDSLNIRNSAWADLDVLCLKAMHKDPERRYRSVEALIRDLDHYLKGEPVDARPDSIRYRAGKFMRRNLRAVVTAAIVFFVIIALTAAFTLRLAKARNAALLEAARTQRIQRFMIDIFQGGDAVAGPATDLKVVDMLDRGTSAVQALNSDPKVRAELLFNFAKIYQKQGHLEKAESLFLMALDQRKLLYGADSAEVAESLTALGLLRADQSRLEEAEPLVRDALAMARNHLATNHAVVIAASVAVGRVLGQRGTYPEAIALLQDAVQTQSAADAPAADLATTLSALADVQYSAGHYEQCAPLYRQLLDMHTRIYGRRHPLVADDLGSLAATMIDLGFYADAEKFSRQAVDVNRSYYGNDHPKVASNLTTLGRALIYQSKYEESMEILEQALTIQERAYGSMHSLVAETLNELGNVASMRNLLDDAEAKFRRAADIYRSIHGDRHFYVAVALSNVGSIRMDKKDYPAAEQIFRDVVRRFNESLGSDNVNTGIARIKLGRTLLREKRFANAEAETLAGYNILRKQTSPSTSYLRAARKDLVAEYDALKQSEKSAMFRAELLATSAPQGAPVPAR
jgi:eukaryotic-like serine/threonine-protein kinase